MDHKHSQETFINTNTRLYNLGKSYLSFSLKGSSSILSSYISSVV